jgi:hypothetical protein
MDDLVRDQRIGIPALELGGVALEGHRAAEGRDIRALGVAGARLIGDHVTRGYAVRGSEHYSAADVDSRAAATLIGVEDHHGRPGTFRNHATRQNRDGLILVGALDQRRPRSRRPE